jgi:hypothetical protein
MRLTGITALFLAVYVSLASALPRLDNLTYLDDWNPNDFIELLDVWVGTDNTVYVTGVGGLMIFDVSDPTDMILLDKWTPQNHPDTRFYNAAVNEDLNLIYCAAREDGLWVFSDFIATDIQLLNSSSFGDLFLEGLALNDEVMYGAAHGNGVMVFAMNSAMDPAWLTTITDGIEDAWRLVTKDQYLFVADGAGGLKIYDTSGDPFNPVLVRSVPTSGPARELALSGDRLVVAVGAAGMDIVNVSDPPNATMIGNYSSENSVFDVALRRNLAYIASWNRVDIVNIAEVNTLTGEPTLVGWEITPGRSMGIGAVPPAVPDTPPPSAFGLGPREVDPTKVVYVADWFSFRAYEVGPPYDPDIQVFPILIETESVSPGSVIDTTYTAINTGGSILEVTDIIKIGTNGDDFEVLSPTTFSLGPGDSTQILVRYTADQDTTVGVQLAIESNDPDEIPFPVYWKAGSGLQLGDPPPDFVLQGLDGFTYRLSDYRDQIVVFAFFATW